MPIYAYRCEQCGHAQDVLQRVSDPVLTVCPACGQATYRKQVTAAGFQLKGSGWYVTDFKGDKKAPAKPSDPADGGAPKPGGEANGDAAKSGAETTVKAGSDGKTDGAAKAPAATPAAAAPAAAAPAAKPGAPKSGGG